ncbi:hypothetical protein Pyn_21468 [Prunus yedoensis var. nudiflora]|uniref:Uncharacterized protein n=1 Tax=Prunus yedoensis var. nudiflora TaxID=2094558 RepID=A0A314YH26_PRUYE|nr:hypothetical protein Pyn_21468 [Prunus yedoensis var. nudiflora]
MSAGLQITGWPARDSAINSILFGPDETNNKDDEVRVRSISLRREGADIHVDVGLCITQEQQISEVLILASNPIGRLD